MRVFVCGGGSHQAYNCICLWWAVHTKHIIVFVRGGGSHQAYNCIILRCILDRYFSQE